MPLVRSAMPPQSSPLLAAQIRTRRLNFLSFCRETMSYARKKDERPVELKVGRGVCCKWSFPEREALSKKGGNICALSIKSIRTAIIVKCIHRTPPWFAGKLLSWLWGTIFQKHHRGTNFISILQPSSEQSSESLAGLLLLLISRLSCLAYGSWPICLYHLSEIDEQNNFVH